MKTWSKVDVEPLPRTAGVVLLDEPMCFHTSYKIGGPADMLAEAADVGELQALIRWAARNSVPVFMLGAGTNLLVSDRGIRGLVIRLGTGFSKVSVRQTTLRAGAAARLTRVVRKALGSQLCGLEGLAGVPGTVGGAVCMNAGTPQGCVKDSLSFVRVVDREGELLECTAPNLCLAYRKSAVPDRGFVITEAVFGLRGERPEDAHRIADALMAKRKWTQPPGIGTAGSVFKNPPGAFAGQLLESVGAKGMQVGGARVSGKHANFIENTGMARAEDVRELMTRLQTLIRDAHGIELEPEIQLVGEW